MPPVALAALRARIADRATSPLCMLVGDDDVEKSAVADEFMAMVDEGLQAFNIDRLHGGETRVDTLVDAANLLPMIASRRIVLVLHAEQLLVPKRASQASDAEQERLEAFLADPPPHTTVVFVCGRLDERRRVVKRLRERADVVDCGTITDAADAERWVRARVAKEGVAMDSAAVRALVQRSGFGIAKLRAGLERVLLYALGQKMVSALDVREAVTAEPDAQVDFGIGKAIWRGDAASALRELGLALDGGTFPVMVLGQLRATAEGLPSERLEAALDAVFRTDLALKSSGGDPRVLIERLTVELCDGGGAAKAGGRGSVGDRARPRRRR